MELKVEKLRKDAEEQEVLVKSQEQELISKKQELENLKLEESRLSTQQNELNQKLNVLSNSLQDSQLNISLVCYLFTISIMSKVVYF